MPMTVELDGAAITTEAALHTAFREASGVEWYGGNLDALFDLLVGIVDPPIAIRWRNAALSRAGIGERYDRLVMVMMDAVAYRGRDKISLLLES